jgi:hypothetical protein
MLSCQHASKTISGDWKAGSKADATRPGSAFSLYSFSVLCLAHLHAASLHLPWWHALSVTIPTVGNRILHRRRRHRQHSGSRHCHNGAFLINFRIADTVLVDGR